MKRDQSGFALIGMLIMVCIIAAVIAVGWLVYESQKVAAPSSNQTAVVNDSHVEEKQQETKYLEIKEWGIKVKLTHADKLTYALKGKSGNNAVFRYVDEAQLLFQSPPAGDPNCKETGIYISQVDNPETFTVKTKVGKFYYGTTVSGGSCEEGALEMKLKTIEELKNPEITAV